MFCFSVIDKNTHKKTHQTSSTLFTLLPALNIGMMPGPAIAISCLQDKGQKNCRDDGPDTIELLNHKRLPPITRFVM